MAGPTVYLVSISVQPGRLETLREYERHAIPIMRRHGGDLQRVLRPVTPGPDGPDEVHLLAFDSPEGFARFRADPELERHRPLREAAVRSATMLALGEVPLAGYLDEPARG